MCDVHEVYVTPAMPNNIINITGLDINYAIIYHTFLLISIDLTESASVKCEFFSDVKLSKSNSDAYFSIKSANRFARGSKHHIHRSLKSSLSFVSVMKALSVVRFTEFHNGFFYLRCGIFFWKIFANAVSRYFDTLFLICFFFAHNGE